jgi:hypothetical protein
LKTDDQSQKNKIRGELHMLHGKKSCRRMDVRLQLNTRRIHGNLASVGAHLCSSYPYCLVQLKQGVEIQLHGVKEKVYGLVQTT